LNYRDLTASLEGAGKPTRAILAADGGRILLLPHGGRVIGLFAAGDDENFYWTHPALESAAAARNFYAGGEWENSGGDRTWIAPELDIFFPRYPDLDPSGYFQPRQLDPGCYRVEECDGAPELVSRLSLDLYRSKGRVDLEVRKRVTPAANPLRHETDPADAGRVRYAGYSQRTSLAITGGQGRVGRCSLLQMPHGGKMIIPTYSRSEPRLYFGSIPAADLEVSGRAVRWRMHARGAHKIGVRAVAAAGRAGYCYGSGERASLVIRNFKVDPSGEYADAPAEQPHEPGDAVQACSVDNAMGSFSELEYHVPAIGGGTGRLHCEDVSEVWAFRGPRAALDRIREKLLGDYDETLRQRL